MNNDKIEHLKFIQGTINRMASHSFQIKAWSMGGLSALIIFSPRYDMECMFFSFLILIIGFWILDSYYLKQERGFRNLYDGVRKGEVNDFDMNVDKYNKNLSTCCIFFSWTLLSFYLIEVLFLAVIIYSNNRC